MKLELKLDLKSIGDSILDGEFDEISLTPDQQVQVINQLAIRLNDLADGGHNIDDEANNLVLWLGGLNRNLTLYGIQLIKLYHIIFFEEDEKTEQRIESVDEFMGPHGSGYEAEDFAAVDRFVWKEEPEETLEERLEQTEEGQAYVEALDELPTGDMIVTGMDKVEVALEPLLAYPLINACVEAISKDWLLAQQKQNIRTNQQIENFAEMLKHQDIDFQIFGVRTLLVTYRVTFDATKCPVMWNDIILGKMEHLILKD